jgi:hypothetical protein
VIDAYRRRKQRWLPKWGGELKPSLCGTDRVALYPQKNQTYQNLTKGSRD